MNLSKTQNNKMCTKKSVTRNPNSSQPGSREPSNILDDLDLKMPIVHLKINL